MLRNALGVELEPGERVLRRGWMGSWPQYVYVRLTDRRLIVKERGLRRPWMRANLTVLRLPNIETCDPIIREGINLLKIRADGKELSILLGWLPFWRGAERWATAILDAKAALEEQTHLEGPDSSLRSG